MLIFLLIFALIRTLQGAPTLELPEIPAFELDTNSIFRRSLTFGTRSVRDIVFSCLATVFACTWTAIHPNIPGPTDSGWTKFKRRVVTMVFALLAPEVVVYWAMRQHFAAKTIVERYNKEVAKDPKPSISFFKAIWRGGIEWFITPELPPKLKKGQARQWSVTHGFFLQMGGFVLCDEGQPIQVLSYKHLVSMIASEEIDAPRTTEAEIQDHGKGDTISKTVAILQTTWFIVQCCARWSNKLPVTELEVVTLGFALLNGITYTLWWNKPQSVGAPVYLELKEVEKSKDVEREATETSQPLEDESEAMSHEEGDTVPLTASRTPVSRKGISLPRNLTKDRGNHHPFRFWTVDVPYQLVQALFRPLYKMGDSNVIAERALRVPMFYAADAEVSDGAIGFAASLIGVLFGSVHLIPTWFLHFPSLTKMWLWRVSAVIITVEPILMALGFLLDGFESNTNILEIIIAIPLFLGLPFYIISRYILIVLAFISLRALPPTALLTIDWVSSIPHI